MDSAKWALRKKGDDDEFWTLSGPSLLAVISSIDAVAAAANEAHPDLALRMEAHKNTVTVRWTAAGSVPPDDVRAAVLAAEASIRPDEASSGTCRAAASPAGAAGAQTPRRHGRAWYPGACPFVRIPPGASEEGAEDFQRFAYQVLQQRDDFVRWEQPDELLDATLERTRRSAHALARTDDRMKQGVVELECSLRSSFSDAYRVAACTLRHNVYAGGQRFAFSKDCCRLISYEASAAGTASTGDGKLRPFPATLVVAALGAVSRYGKQNVPHETPLAPELEAALRAAIGAPENGSTGSGSDELSAASSSAGDLPRPCVWREDPALVVLTTTARLVFSPSGGWLRTVIPVSFEDWRRTHKHVAPPIGGGGKKAKTAARMRLAAAMRRIVAAAIDSKKKEKAAHAAAAAARHGPGAATQKKK